MVYFPPSGRGPARGTGWGTRQDKEAPHFGTHNEQHIFIFVLGKDVEASVDVAVVSSHLLVLDGLVKEHRIPIVAYMIGYVICNWIGYNVGALLNIRSIILVSFSSYFLYKVFVQIVFLGVPKLTKFDANVGLVRGLTQN